MIEEEGCQGKFKNGDKLPVSEDRAAGFDITLTLEATELVDNTHQIQDCLDKISQWMVCQEADIVQTNLSPPMRWRKPTNCSFTGALEDNQNVPPKRNRKLWNSTVTTSFKVRYDIHVHTLHMGNIHYI